MKLTKGQIGLHDGTLRPNHGNAGGDQFEHQMESRFALPLHLQRLLTLGEVFPFEQNPSDDTGHVGQCRYRLDHIIHCSGFHVLEMIIFCFKFYVNV